MRSAPIKFGGATALSVLMLLRFAPAVAQTEPTCPVKQFRWEENCSNLRGEALTGIEQLRYIPLDDAGDVWLTFGGEYRLKMESLDAPDFDIRPTDHAFTAIGERFLAHADLRTSFGIRLFAQFSGATDTGRVPMERPFDRSSIDVAQAFIDLPVPILDGTTLRFGRQELDAEGNRLISTRDAANLRRAFDMAHLETAYEGFRLVAFYGRPVLNRIGAFDDGGDPRELFYGGWIERKWSEVWTAPTTSLFFFQRDRALAIYQDGVSSDHRRTLGARIAGGDSQWDFALQAADQFGSFGSSDITAYGFAGDFGWHPDVWARPRIAASFGYASGDANPGDRTLGTFDVLYPNLGYFTDAPIYYPGNTADVQPNMTLNPFSELSVRAGSDIIWRISKFDAVYEPPGIPLVRGNGQGPSFVGALSYLRGDWTIDPYVTLSASAAHGMMSSLIHNAGGRDFNYASVTLDFHA